MDIKLKERFLAVWEIYFDETELPMFFYYADKSTGEELIQSPSRHRCIMADLSKVRTGKSICFNADSFGCFGGKRYLGFPREVMSNFDVGDLNGVFSPFSAGCGSIVQYPYLEKGSDFPRAVPGMFDVSARPFMPGDVLSFSVPMNKFITMVENMDESFLITPSWHKIQKRIKDTRKE